MKKLSFVLVLFCFILNTNEANAQELSLSTYPSTIQLRAQPPADAKSIFTIENKSSKPVKLTIQLKQFKPDPTEDGKVLYLEGADPTIFKQIQVLDDEKPVNTIELGPKQIKNLALRINIPQQEKPADYYFSIVFVTAQPETQEETVTEATARSYAQAGIALNVLLAISPKQLPQGYLEEFSTPSFRSAGPVPFTVKIKNTGDHYFSPKGVILIKNIFGQTVGRVDLQNTNILARTGRSMLGIPYSKTANDASVQTQSTPSSIETAIWPEKFLLGIYKAELSIALSEEGPLFNQTLTFLALPTNIILASGIVGIVAFLIALRIRKRLKET